jgi:hypothetical protein
MNNRLISAKKHFRASITSLKVKILNLDAELEKVNQKFEDLMDEVDRYKYSIDVNTVRATPRQIEEPEETPQENLDIGGTIGIFDTLVRAIAKDADDFKLACESILFPTVFKRVIALDQFYFLDAIPDSAAVVIKQGRETLEWLREEFDTHITDPSAWPLASDIISIWWLNTALPLLYGVRDERWDEDKPFTHSEMETWRDYPGERATQFSAIFSGYEYYINHKDEIDKNLGLSEFEIKTFTF